jgi:hypothetical protein
MNVVYQERPHRRRSRAIDDQVIIHFEWHGELTFDGSSIDHLDRTGLELQRWRII